MLLLSHIKNVLVPLNVQVNAFNADRLRLPPNLRIQQSVEKWLQDATDAMQ